MARRGLRLIVGGGKTGCRKPVNTGKAVEVSIAIYEDGVRFFGAVQAVRFLFGMGKVFLLLSDDPENARNREEITPLVRVLPYGSHLVVYLLERTGDILLVPVHHGHEDWREDSA